ncbi:hypothetical protein NLU13_0142 [Sarocladium strictum]|uniref:Wax synthase domain-containing protein n=1 Tax=Sarocladium strictum TaxID=5046 RepID=A0AA39GNH7_SARSR|nr:hypothetical protein NLU13_0142 [Sarocladium strictum]
MVTMLTSRSLSPLIPLLSYGAASIITIHSLRLRKHARRLVLFPVLLLSLLSLATSKRLSWPFGLDSTFASMIVFYLPYSVRIIGLDDLPSDPETSLYPWTFINCYRIWNNPRALPSRHTSSLGVGDDPWDNRKEGKHRRDVFAVQRGCKVAALSVFDSLVFQNLLLAAFRGVTAADFAPDMELLLPGDILHMSAHDIRIRSIISIQWIWSAYFFLESSHCVLSIIFVSILHFDQPDEWPALFGSPLQGSSIRGFWARFWHRLPIPTYTYYALIICRSMLATQPGSRVEKTVVPMFIFLFAGLSHSVVGWAMGDAALERDVLFFMLNYAAAVVEVAVEKARKSKSGASRPLLRVPNLVSQALGLAGVFLFFFCIVPAWMYPKIHPAIVAAQATTSRAQQF